VKHPSFKQQRCPLEVAVNSALKKCNKPLDRRATFALSEAISSKMSQHLPVGSGLLLCNLNLDC
jgi:hypothetical protein